MKYFKYLNLIILASFIFTACDDEILDNNPYYMGDSADQIYKDENKIAAANYGLYDALQNAEFLGGRAQIYVDIRGLDVNPPSYFGLMSSFNPTSNDATITLAWQGAYRTVGECNAFLEGIEKAKADNIITAEVYNIYASDARFIRGLVYFYALNLWGQMYVAESSNLGIPLVSKAFDGTTGFTEATKLTRATITESYNFIISDLQFAASNLPATRGDVYKGKATATSTAANALLSRVYLYMNDYPKAIEYANKVTGLTLAPSIFGALSDPANSTESIFSVAMNFADNPNTNNSLGQHYGAAKRADITVSSAYLGLLSATDARKTDCLVVKGSNTYVAKYTATGNADWAPIIRYAEVLLNKAEALAKKTGATTAEVAEAVSLLNQVHGRSEPTKIFLVTDFPTNGALVEEILLERRRELAFEGHASFDLFRNAKGIPAGRGAATAAALPYPSNSFALPIPSDDVTKSAGALVQNKGY